jgi:hypothetical protein
MGVDGAKKSAPENDDDSGRVAGPKTSDQLVVNPTVGNLGTSSGLEMTLASERVSSSA